MLILAAFSEFNVVPSDLPVVKMSVLKILLVLLLV